MFAYCNITRRIKHSHALGFSHARAEVMFGLAHPEDGGPCFSSVNPESGDRHHLMPPSDNFRI